MPKHANKERPKVIALCGSSKFVDFVAVTGWLLERDEGAIVIGLHLLPGWYNKEFIPDHLAEYEGVDKKMDALHLEKIRMSDEVFVVNYEHYIGDSTENEIRFAEKLGKPIRWFTDDEIGKDVMVLFDQAVYQRKLELEKEKNKNLT